MGSGGGEIQTYASPIIFKKLKLKKNLPHIDNTNYK
jgi:hypothetical protein